MSCNQKFYTSSFAFSSNICFISCASAIWKNFNMQDYSGMFRKLPVYYTIRSKARKSLKMSYKSRRDNFSQSAITILYKRAGGKCCRCGAATFGPVTNNPTKYRNIGQAAHIAAAAPGGPRFDPDMSVEDRTSATNGLWLCSNCHDVVDRDVEEFTIKRLREIKREGEERARREVGVASSVSGGFLAPS